MAFALLAVATPARAEVRRQPSVEAQTAFAANNLEHFDQAILAESEACLAAPRGPEDCLDLLLIVRSRLRGFAYFDRDEGPPLGWDPSRRQIVPNPAKGKRAAELGREAADRVLALYGRDTDLLGDGEARVTPATAQALITLYEALPDLLSSTADPATAQLRNAIAAKLHALGQRRAAMQMVTGSVDDPAHVEALAARLGPDAPAVLAIRNNRAVLYGASDAEPSEPVAAWRRLAATRARVGPPLAAAITGLNLAAQLRAEGDYEAARDAYAANLPAISEAWGANDPRVAGVLAGYAATVSSLGREADAERLLREARAIFVAVGGPSQLAVLRIDAALAHGLIAQDRTEDAEQIARAAIAAAAAPLDQARIAVVAAVRAGAAANPMISAVARAQFEPDTRDAQYAAEEAVAALQYELSLALFPRDPAGARAAAHEAARIRPYDPRYVLQVVNSELGRQWPDAIEEWRLDAMLSQILATLGPDRPERIDAFALGAVLALKRFKSAVAALPHLRLAAVQIQRRIASQGTDDSATQRELSRYAPVYRAQLRLAWIAAH